MSLIGGRINGESLHINKGGKLERNRYPGVKRGHEVSLRLSCFAMKRITGQPRDTNRTSTRDADGAKAADAQALFTDHQSAPYTTVPVWNCKCS